MAPGPSVYIVYIEQTFYSIGKQEKIVKEILTGAITIASEPESSLVYEGAGHGMLGAFNAVILFRSSYAVLFQR